MRRLLTSVLGVVLCTSALATAQTTARAAAGPVAPADVAAPAGVDARAAEAAERLVTMRASHSARTGGQRFVLRGTARTERGVRRVVSIEARAMGAWDTVTKVRTSRKGVWKVTLRAPNPTATVRLGLRAEVEKTRNKKVRKAWRKEGRSTVTRITFRNNPAIAQPTYTLSDPVACDSGTPGVMARTAACVAAVEVQAVERMWRDVRRMEGVEDSTEELLQLAVLLQPGRTRSEEFHNLTVALPYFTGLLREAEYLASTARFDMVLFAAQWIGYGVQEIVAEVDPSIMTATEWKPAWGEQLMVNDLATITISGDTATTPVRTFTADSSELSIGGTWTYADGRWWSELDPMADLRTAPRGAASSRWLS
jgi:hypothetical protein